MKKCSVCGEKINICDSCADPFDKGDAVFCCTRDFDEHFCLNCSDEEGEVE